MRAIIRETPKTSLKEINAPQILNEDDIIIRVAYAGLCRTDIYIADGIIDVSSPRVLGHEFSGIVAEIGENVSDISIGDRVTVMPIIPCGTCNLCTTSQSDLCQDTKMLGLDIDGAFAEYIRVPKSCVYKLPDTISLQQAAYSEPLAAGLSVLKANIKPEQKGVILGNNRFGKLIHLILKTHGFENISIYDFEEKEPVANTYDFAIETSATAQVMRIAFNCVKPKGTVVLKSRKHELVGINFSHAIAKELSLQAVNYANFQETIALLARDDFSIDNLFGEAFLLDDFEVAFAQARKGENLKIFLAVTNDLIGNDNVRPR